jgi:hypothetical protein
MGHHHPRNRRLERRAAFALVLTGALAAGLAAPAPAHGFDVGLGAPPRVAGPGVPCPDGARPAFRAAASPAGTLPHAAPPADTTGFVLFGWVTPPDDSLSEARVAEMAAIGLNLMLPTWLDEGCPSDNLAKLDWAEAHGMRCLLWDSRLMGAYRWLPTFEDTLDQVTAEYRDHPAFWGYYLGDEPPESRWPMLGRLRASLRARDPVHPGWDTNLGRVSFASREAFEDQLRGYASAFSPVVMSADHYDFRTFGDLGLYVDHVGALREVADEHSIPFWTILQLTPHANIRPLRPGELRWQVAQALAYGARGIGYFTYWTPDPDPSVNWQSGIIGNDGQRTGWYDFLRGFNPGVRIAGDVLAKARRIRTTHAGSVPIGGAGFEPDQWIRVVTGRSAIGEFRGAVGERLVLVANADSLAAATLTLETRDAPAARLMASGSSPYALTAEPGPVGARLTLGLAAGDFALLALDPAPPRPTLVATPNPGRGSVRFSLEAPGGGARLTITDLAGRLVWSGAPSASVATVEWRGERHDGRPARPGVYFARLSSSGGEASCRFVWFGSR